MSKKLQERTCKKPAATCNMTATLHQMLRATCNATPPLYRAVLLLQRCSCKRAEKSAFGPLPLADFRPAIFRAPRGLQ